MSLSIGEVVRRSGLTHDTLRYYERIGLIPAVARTSAGQRVYQESVLDQLAVVTALRSAGFSIAQVHTVLGVKADNESTVDRISASRVALDDLEASLNEKEQSIQQARDLLNAWRNELEQYRESTSLHCETAAK